MLFKVTEAKLLAKLPSAAAAAVLLMLVSPLPDDRLEIEYPNNRSTAWPMSVIALEDHAGKGKKISDEVKQKRKCMSYCC